MILNKTIQSDWKTACNTVCGGHHCTHFKECNPIKINEAKQDPWAKNPGKTAGQRGKHNHQKRAEENDEVNRKAYERDCREGKLSADYINRVRKSYEKEGKSFTAQDYDKCVKNQKDAVTNAYIHFTKTGKSYSAAKKKAIGDLIEEKRNYENDYNERLSHSNITTGSKEYQDFMRDRKTRIETLRNTIKVWYDLVEEDPKHKMNSNYSKITAEAVEHLRINIKDFPENTNNKPTGKKVYNPECPQFKTHGKECTYCRRPYRKDGRTTDTQYLEWIKKTNGTISKCCPKQESQESYKSNWRPVPPTAKLEAASRIEPIDVGKVGRSLFGLFNTNSKYEDGFWGTTPLVNYNGTPCFAVTDHQFKPTAGITGYNDEVYLFKNCTDFVKYGSGSACYVLIPLVSTGLSCIKKTDALKMELPPVDGARCTLIGLNPKTPNHDLVFGESVTNVKNDYLYHSVSTYDCSCGSAMISEGYIVGLHVFSHGKSSVGDNNACLTFSHLRDDEGKGWKPA